MSTRKEYRDILITALAMWLWFWFNPVSMFIIVQSVFAALLIIAFIPPLRRLNHLMWHYITLGMQTVMHPILFSLIYFLVLVPIGLMYRRFKKRKNQEESTFVAAEIEVNKEFFNVPW